MLEDAIQIRKIDDGNETKYEVYDSDTGTSIGIHSTLESAEAVRQDMQESEDSPHIRSYKDGPGTS
ncbi:hypothetical protein [Aidingimonas lacisalsi]|uniref:hypothetical protein n=1 Tax=Aidingimonas lacisalsi TaxID=2604086 RepID=UPI0011D2B40D|nr:hypothetical protein [Aidingimonas lacisalsi]